MDYMLSSVSRKILLENINSSEERKELNSIVNEAAIRLDNQMIMKLYDAALKKKNVDFGTIPSTAGDITKYEGYNNMVEVIQTIRSIASTSGTPEELNILETSLDNLRGLKPQFELAFKLRKELPVMLYNTMVYYCVKSTSSIIGCFIDYVKSPDAVEIKYVNRIDKEDAFMFSQLKKFNESCKRGDVSKVLINVNGTKSNAISMTTIAIPVAIISGLLLIVPLIRELITRVYHARVKLSDYLKMQAEFLEFNKTAVMNNPNLTERKKKEILKKQAETAKKLIKWSEKIKIDNKESDKISEIELKKENKVLTLGNLNPKEEKKEEKAWSEDDIDDLELL